MPKTRTTHHAAVRVQEASGSNPDTPTKYEFQILGFSDHTPYFFENGYSSRIRMKCSQLPDYVSCLQALKKQYAKQIEIHIGLEAEYYPSNFQNTLEMIRDQEIEYLILGQHFISEETTGVYSGSPTTDESVLKLYCKQCLDALASSSFTYFAHPDLIHYIGSETIYRKHMRHLLREVKQMGIPVEINLLGFIEGRHYPGNSFLELVAEENCPAVLGIDAHMPEHLTNRVEEDRLRSIIAAYGITLLDHLDLIKP